MARIAMDPAAHVELRARMLAELAPYLYPRRRAVEHSGAEDKTIIVRWTRDDEKL
jgi:hypothetical protein